MTVRLPAEPGDRFANGCFDGSIGKDVTLTINGSPVEGRLISAVVVDDGAAAMVTVESGAGVAAEAFAAFVMPPGDGSVGPPWRTIGWTSG